MNTTERKSLDKLAFIICITGSILAAVITILGKFLNDDYSMIAYSTFVGLEITALVLGIVSRAQPLGKTSAIASSILLIGSLAVLS